MSEIATRATTLWSLDVVKAALRETGDSSHDEAIVRLADGISALLERETRRWFVTREVVETRNGDGGHELYLYRRPIVTVTSVAVRRWPTDAQAEVIIAANYRLDAAMGLLDVWNDVLTRGVGNVIVTYDAGYGAQDAPTLPADIHMAGLDLVKHVWDQDKAGGLAAQTVTLANGASFVPRERWPLHVQRAIDDWTATGF